MRIALLGHREIASNLALSLLAKQLTEHELAVFLSGSLTETPVARGPLEELDAVEASLCDRLDSSGGQALWPDSGIDGFAELAERTGRKLAVLDDPNSDAGLGLLQEFAPDLIVSVRYRRILKAAAISLPTFGVVNLHSGLLPEYKGAMATFWSMLAGEKRMGWTLHYIVDGTIDTGPVIDRLALSLDYSACYLRNVLALYPSAVPQVVQAVRCIARDGRVASMQQVGAGRYYSFPRDPDFRRFRDAGHRLYAIDEIEDFRPDNYRNGQAEN